MLEQARIVGTKGFSGMALVSPGGAGKPPCDGSG